MKRFKKEQAIHDIKDAMLNYDKTTFTVTYPQVLEGKKGTDSNVEIVHSNPLPRVRL